MSILRRILQILACLLLGMYVILIFALDTPRVQIYLADAAEEQLESYLGCQLDINRISVGLFNAVELHDVVVHDKRGEIMLKSQLIYGKVRLRSLLSGRIDLRNISILDSDIKLYKDTKGGPLNIKFLIDAFKSDKAQKRPLDLTINSLLLRRCQLAYDEEYQPHPIDNRFSPHHIFLHDVNANMSLKQLTDSQLQMRIRQMSFAEQSGFKVKNLRLNMYADRTHSEIHNLRFELPNSLLEQAKITINYDFNRPEELFTTISVNEEFDNIILSTRDLYAFVPTIKGIDEQFSLSTKFSYKRGSLSLQDIVVNNAAETFHFSGDAHITHDNPLAISTSIDRLKVDQAFLSSIFLNVLDKPCPSQLVAVGAIEYQGLLSLQQEKAAKNFSASRISAKGKLSTSLGVLDTDLQLADERLDIALASSSFNPSPLYAHKFVPTFLDFKAKASTSLSKFMKNGMTMSFHNLGQTETDLQVNAVTLNNQTFKNIHAFAKYDVPTIELHLTTDDPSAKLQMSAYTKLQANSFATIPSELVFDFNIDQLQPSQLHLTNQLGQGTIAAKAAGQVHAFGTENFSADIQVDDFQLHGDNGNVTPYHLKNFSLQLQPTPAGSHIMLRSDFADLDYSGPTDLQKLKVMAQNIYKNIKEGVFNESVSANEIEKALVLNESSVVSNSNRIDDNFSTYNLQTVNFIFSLRNADLLNRVFRTKINYNGTIHVQGSASSDGNHLKMACQAPHFSFGKFSVNDLSLYVRSEDGSFNILGKGHKYVKNGDIRVELTSINRDGKIYTDIEWDEAYRHFVYGKLSAVTTINNDKHNAPIAFDQSETNTQSEAISNVFTTGPDELHLATPTDSKNSNISFVTEFTPSSICIGDSLWQLSRSRVEYKNKRVKIDGFGIHNATQSLTVNGIYDRAFEDAITVDLNNLDLDYVLAMARLQVVEFSGHATGKIFVRALPDGSPWAKAVVNVPDLQFNHAKFGNADVTLGWDHANKDITIDGNVVEKGIGYTKVKGYVDPINRDLDLHTESKNTQLAFLNKYTADIFHNVSGRATGYCRIYGGFQTIEFSGHEIGEAEATVPVTGVTYKLRNADIDIVPDTFKIKSTTIQDDFFGAGTAYGTLAHNHLKDLNYDFHLEGNDLRLYDKPRELDMPFFATATGSGNVHIHGIPGVLNAEIRIKTTPGSELTYLLDSPDADVSQLLTFHDVTPIDSDTITTLLPIFNDDQLVSQRDTLSSSFTTSQNPLTLSTTSSTTPMDFNLYFEVDVDNNSSLHLITDDKSGDAIITYGSGPIQANYHNKSGFQMFGTYNIDRGTYNLNIPSLAQRRKFDILSGGQVTFSGDPSQAEVKVKAQYVVNSASLADLNIGTGFANNTTRVNCLANIYGEVANMQFDLGLELPNCSQDEQQMVNNLIATDEDRTMQVLYLMGVGRFYAYNYTAADIGQSQSVLMMNSLLSSTLSSQLNNIIADAVGSSNWTFGTNISTGQLGWNDMEVEGLVSSRLLNNRLLINGNFGYSDRRAATTNFVGDFDMQYLITPKGTVSIKAYSETNDRYFTKSTLTTQGVGLQLKKDFTKFVNLFRRKRPRHNNAFEK